MFVKVELNNNMNFAKEVIENLLKEVEPIKEEKSPKTGDTISLINAIKRTNGDFS